MSKWLVTLGLVVVILGMSLPHATALQSLDRVLVSSERLVNAFGDQVSGQVNIGQQVQVATDIANGQNESQLFVYILQIKNEQGILFRLVQSQGNYNQYNHLMQHYHGIQVLQEFTLQKFMFGKV